MRAFTLKPTNGCRLRRVGLATCIVTCLAGIATLSKSHAQLISPLQAPLHDDIAEQEQAWTLKKFPSQQYMREIFWHFTDPMPAFFRDSLFQIVARSYYLTRDNFNGTRSQAWAGGGWLAFRSGLIADMFGVHAAVYTSQPIYAPPGEDGTKLLAPGQHSLGSLGQLYGRVQLGDQEIRGGRQLVDTPLINPQDNRMVPNTFEAATLVSLPDKDRNYDYAAGYIWTIKQRDSNAFVSMSDVLAASQVDTGAPFAMVKYRPFPGFSTVLMDYYVQDFVNTGFGQAEYVFQTPKELPKWMLGANIIDQRSVGNDMLTGYGFNTYQASGKVQVSHAGWTLFAAGSITGDEQKITSPYGTKPNYTDMQQVSFDNAGEKAIGGSVAYDFGYAYGSLGLSGLSAGAWYTQGWGALNPTTNSPIPNRRELDLWIQYRPTEGPLKGLRVRTAFGNVWQDGNVRGTQPEFRALADYTVLFRPPVN